MNKAEKHAEICAALNEIYKAKNADYADSFGEAFKEFGPISAVVRMDDKMRRIKQLISNPAKVKNESLADSVQDLGNYCIMFLIELAAAAEKEESIIRTDDGQEFRLK